MGIKLLKFYVKLIVYCKYIIFYYIKCHVTLYMTLIDYNINHNEQKLYR